MFGILCFGYLVLGVMSLLGFALWFSCLVILLVFVVWGLFLLCVV